LNYNDLSERYLSLENKKGIDGYQLTSNFLFSKDENSFLFIFVFKGLFKFLSF